MGEYATYRGSSIKIGTCESMYYLRADQRHEVSGYDFGPDVLDAIRFRFPFPSEDGTEPGAFEDYDHGMRIPGWSLPASYAEDHGIVQFTSSAGYNLCITCPESIDSEPGFGPIDVHGVKVHRNGFRGHPVIKQQAFRDGHLATIVGCGACGALWRLTADQAEEVAVCFRSEADRQEFRRDGLEDAHTEHTKRELHMIADRILAGYGLTPTLV